MFSEQQAQRFPEARQWDHAIDLKKDTPTTLPGKKYSLTQPEQKALQEFLQEHLKKGYIRPLKSPYTDPFFFIKKKDRKLRPIQDYRKVNEWTIKNRYPLPLIPELINRVKGATLFLLQPRVILVPCVHLCLPLLRSYLICMTGLLIAVYWTHFGLSC